MRRSEECEEEWGEKSSQMVQTRVMLSGGTTLESSWYTSMSKGEW